ncbi:hypothetical protein Gpo141_00009713 [Globisporangium polare]
MNAAALSTQAAYEPHVGGAFPFDDEQHLLDELLLEIFAPPPTSSPTSSAVMESSNNDAMYASPASTRYSYDSSGNMSASNQRTPLYPANNSSNNNNAFWGVSPVKKPSDYKGHQPPPIQSSFTPGSPSAAGSSGDENDMYMENGGFDDMEVTASDSTMSAKKKRQLEMRRKRNRESMRRVRQRKRIHYSELKTMLPGLEKRLAHLQELKAQREARQLACDSTATALVESTNALTGAPGPDLVKAMESLRIAEEAARRENAWLEQEIDKYQQAFVALQDEISELREENARTEAPLENDPFAWTSHAIPLLPQFHQAEMVEFVRHSAVEVIRQVRAAHNLPETATGVFGWRTWRTVDGPWIHFAVSKDFMHEDVEVVAQKTWFVNSQSHTIHTTMPRNHYMKVLRVVNENTIICARNLFFPGDEINYCNIYLLMNIKTANGFVVAQRSLLPADFEVLRRHLGAKFSYVNVFYAMILERLTVDDEDDENPVFLPTGFKATFGGLASNGTEIYANTWAKDLFIAMLRWESACVGPLYRLL